jgi:CHAT domain-containing protein
MSAPTDPRDAQLTLDDLVRHLAANEDETARRELLLARLQDFDHETLLTTLKDESERYRTSDIGGSLRLAEALIFAAERAGYPAHRAMGLMARGDALRARGHFAQAVAGLDEAGEAFLALGDEVGWARTRIGWILAAYELGQGEAALAVTDRARDVLTRAGMWLRAGILELNAGTVRRNLGRYEEALAGYERARQAFASLGAAAEEHLAWVDVNTANVLPFLGDYQAALRLHEEVRELWLRRGDTVRGAWQDHNIAFVLAGLGFYTRALRGYAAAAAALERAGFPFEAAGNDLYAVECYLRLNMLPEALELAEATLARYEGFGTPPEIARARLFCALAYGRGGDYERARLCLDGATAGFRATGLAEEFALCTLERASLALRSRDWATALATAEQARRFFGEHRLIVRRAQADLVWARAALGSGDGAAATEVALAAVALAEARAVPWLIPEGRALLGDIARGRGDLDGALSQYERAIGHIEEMQRFLAIDLRGNFLADKRQIYGAAIDVSLQTGRDAQAFAYLERAKSRALVDYVASHLDIRIRSRTQGDQERLEQLARLRAEHHWLYNELYDDTLARQSGERSRADDESLRCRIRDRERQIARLLEQLALDRTEGLEIAPGLDDRRYRPPTDLEPGAVLLEYVLRDGHSAVFVVVAGELLVVPLAASVQEIGRLLKGWHLNLAATAGTMLAGIAAPGLVNNARTILRALYRALIAPVEAHLADCARLIVVPDGPLHAVPFQALHDGERYLIERREVASCPASGLLRLCRERARRHPAGAGLPSALVVAHSDAGRLPFVPEEARAVAALMPGEVLLEEAATRDALRAAAPRHPILHLAAHGEARLDNPAFAYLKLADGHLGTIDVFNLDLPGALVVLSGCETGRSVVTDGDELIGLSRGFLYAGAATLVQSLWRVEDGATARLMARFYRALKDGRTKGAALREAQLALLRDEQSHPFLWAPFQLIGDDGPLVAADGRAATAMENAAKRSEK